MKMKKLSQLALAVSAAMMLAACGGGGGDDKSGGNAGGGNTEAGGKPSEGGEGGGVNEGAKPIDQIDYANVETYQLGGFPKTQAQFCNANATKAYGGNNTATFAEDGVSDEVHRQVAIYAEASVEYIKSKMGISKNTEGFGDGEVISVCARANSSNGSGFHNAIEVGVDVHDDIPYDQPGDGLKTLVLHEMIHVMHARLANCWNESDTYGIVAKWFSEGSALYLAGQDRYYTGDLEDLRKMAGENPYSWIENGYPNYDRYPVYRLAVEAMVDASGKTQDDLWKFMADYFKNHNNSCNAEGYKTFNTHVSNYFGNILEDQDYLDSFWTTTLEKYALPE